MKAKPLPLEMEGMLTAAHGKDVPDRSKGPAVKKQEITLNNVRSRVRQVDEQGSPVTDTAMVSCSTNLRYIAGGCADEAAIEAAQVAMTVDDQEDVAEAIRLDAVDEMTEQLEGTLAWGA